MSLQALHKTKYKGTTKQGELPKNEPLNRYCNILPCLLFDCVVPLFSSPLPGDHSICRVDKLKNAYINANTVSLYDRQFILAQAPLTETIEAFWAMVYQYQVRVIVKLCICSRDESVSLILHPLLYFLYLFFFSLLLFLIFLSFPCCFILIREPQQYIGPNTTVH